MAVRRTESHLESKLTLSQTGYVLPFLIKIISYFPR